MPSRSDSLTPARPFDPESAGWLERLRPGSTGHDAAVGELHVLLLKAARFEVRRRGVSAELGAGELEDLAQQSADDALVVLLGKLDDFRGESRFTTWAYKFALLEAAVRMRRRAWQDREVKLDAQAWSLIGDPVQAPHEDSEAVERLRVLRHCIEEDLTAHQREVLVAIALNDVPIDVLAERRSTTRGALYKTLHDARRKLRASLASRGFELDPISEVSRS